MMYPRIMGMEVEYGLTAMHQGQVIMPPDQAAEVLFTKIVHKRGGTDVFIENGARLYLDVGAHPEYATAECIDPADVVVQDAAGQAIYTAMAEQATARLNAQGIQGEIALWRTNGDGHGNSWGAHENYAMRREGSFAKHMDVLMPFLVSRQIMIGAGGFVQDGDQRTFVLSPRADHMWDAMSASTTRTRPIVNVRDEPLADTTTYRRLHVISGDTNMNEYQTWVKFGTMDILLRMMESGVVFTEMPLEDPIRAIKTFARDLTGRERMPLASGRAASALEIQTMYQTRAAKWVQSTGQDAYHHEIVDAWGELLEQLSTDPMALDGSLDWVAKYRMLDQYAVRNNIPVDDARLAMVEMQYARLGPKGLFSIMQRQGKTRRVTDDATIAQAMVTPPGTTRARLRGMFITQAMAAQRAFSADWMHLRIEDGEAMTLTLDDPFVAEDEGIERIIASM